jgi:acylglycerol lipase
MGKPKSNPIPKLDLNSVQINPLIQKLRIRPNANDVEYNTFQTSDGTKLFYRYWKRDRNKEMNDTLIFIFHGMAGQTEYWHLLADQLIDQCDMIGVDHRGHGYSEGKRGDIDSFGMYIDDAKEYMGWFLNDNPISKQYKKIFCIGESMGTVVLANLIKEGLFELPKHHDIRGIIYFAPALGVSANSISISEIFKTLSYILLYPFNKGALRVRTRGNEEAGAWDPVHQEYDATDPLHLEYVSLRYLLQIKKYMDRANKNGAADITIPFLMLYGGNDQVVGHNASVKYAQKGIIDDIIVKKINNAKHALFTDPNFQEHWPFLLNWLKKRAN